MESHSGCGAAWLARLLGVQEVPSSNLGSPTKFLKDLQAPGLPQGPFWSPTGVQNGRIRRLAADQGRDRPISSCARTRSTGAFSNLEVNASNAKVVEYPMIPRCSVDLIGGLNHLVTHVRRCCLTGIEQSRFCARICSVQFRRKNC